MWHYAVTLWVNRHQPALLAEEGVGGVQCSLGYCIPIMNTALNEPGNFFSESCPQPPPSTYCNRRGWSRKAIVWRQAGPIDVASPENVTSTRDRCVVYICFISANSPFIRERQVRLWFVLHVWLYMIIQCNVNLYTAWILYGLTSYCNKLSLRNNVCFCAPPPAVRPLTIW